MRFRKAKEEEPRLGITPLIDVVFLLLIFFMLTSHFHVASGIPIRLPKIAQKTYDTGDKKIIMIVDKKNRIYLEGEKVDIKQLADRLRDLIKEKGLAHLILQADRDVRHGKVVQIMDIAKREGVSSIIIAAQWEPEKV